MTEPRIITLGCRLNAYETEIMRGHARHAGVTDTVIINTCAVTAEAERQARQAIRRARRETPSARIVVTGCAAQIDPGIFRAVARQQLDIHCRQEQFVVAVVMNFQAVVGGATDLDGLQAHVAADAVLHVHHQIACRPLAQNNICKQIIANNGLV